MSSARGHFMRWRVVLVVVCVGLTLGLTVLWPRFVRLRERMDGRFRAEDYAAVLSTCGPALDFMPRAIPSTATDVSIYCPNMATFSLLPSPDLYVTVSFTLPANEIEALIKTSQVRSGQLRDQIGAQRFDQLHSLPPPANELVYLLANPKGMDTAGITIDSARGRVEYWYRGM